MHCARARVRSMTWTSWHWKPANPPSDSGAHLNMHIRRCTGFQYICRYLYTYIYTYMCIHVCICICIYIYVHVRVYISLYMHVYIHVYVFVHICTHLQKCICKYVYRCRAATSCVLAVGLERKDQGLTSRYHRIPRGGGPSAFKIHLRAMKSYYKRLPWAIKSHNKELFEGCQSLIGAIKG